MSEHTVILEPGAPANATVAAPEGFAGGLKGKVVGFIDNTKPNFDLLARDIADLLTREYGVSRIVTHRKRAPSDPASEPMLRDLQEKCDLVIAGSGD
jgi:hypothetical protein